MSERMHRSQPRVSIIIPTHNRPHLLPRAVESAQRSGVRVEVIVVDDESVDETAEVCSQLAGIRYIRVERRRGVAGARNAGILASQGEYISFLDDDDLRLPGSIDAQLALLEAHPEAGLVYGQMLRGDQTRAHDAPAQPARCPQGDVFWKLLEHNFIPCGAALFRKSCLLRVGLLEESMAGVDDWDLWLRIAELYEVLALEEPVLLWRQSDAESGQLSSHLPHMLMLSAHLLRTRGLRLPRAAAATAERREALWQRYRTGVTHYLLWDAGRALRKRGFRVAGRNISTALRFNPAGVARSIFHPAAREFYAGALSHR